MRAHGLRLLPPPVEFRFTSLKKKKQQTKKNEQTKNRPVTRTALPGTPFAGTVAPPPENYYALPASSACLAVLGLLLLCFVCHRRLKRRVQESGPLGAGHHDDLAQRVDERTGRCFHHHHHQLLQHHHHHHHHHHAHPHYRQDSQQGRGGHRGASLPDDEDDELDERASLDDYRGLRQPSPPSDEDDSEAELELVGDDDEVAACARDQQRILELEEAEELADETSSSPESSNTARPPVVR